MSTITKESITDTIEGLEHLANSGIQSVYIDMAIAGMRRLLASLEAEAVAFVMADDLKDSSIISTPAYRDLGEAMERAVGDVVALYAIHPAPASLDAGDRLSNFIASQESLSGDFEKVLAENIEELYVPSKSATTAPVSVPDFGALTKCIVQRLVDYGAADDDAIASAEEFVYNACRAAMLQGAEPVSNRDEFPDGWVACSERMPGEVLAALHNVARLMRNLNDFCGEKSVIAKCLIEAEEALLNAVNRHSTMLAEPLKEAKNV